VAALPSNRLWPHAACQGHSHHEAQAIRLLSGPKPLSPFVPACRVITPGSAADGSRLPCRARATALVLQHPGLDLRPDYRRRFRAGSTQATLPHYGFSQQIAATSTWPTKPGTGLPIPEAAVVPALASVFNSEVTLLGPVMARSARVRAVFRQAALSRRFCWRNLCARRVVGFPPTKPEARGTDSQTDVRHLAPSPQNLTGKPSLTYSVGPFVVELFAAIGFADGHRGSQPRFCLSPDRSSPRQPR
jgi:hypothetical protein